MDVWPSVPLNAFQYSVLSKSVWLIVAIKNELEKLRTESSNVMETVWNYNSKVYGNEVPTSENEHITYFFTYVSFGLVVVFRWLSVLVEMHVCAAMLVLLILVESFSLLKKTVRCGMAPDIQCTMVYVYRTLYNISWYSADVYYWREFLKRKKRSWQLFRLHPTAHANTAFRFSCRSQICIPFKQNGIGIVIIIIIINLNVGRNLLHHRDCKYQPSFI